MKEFAVGQSRCFVLDANSATKRNP